MCVDLNETAVGAWYLLGLLLFCLFVCFTGAVKLTAMRLSLVSLGFTFYVFSEYYFLVRFFSELVLFPTAGFSHRVYCRGFNEANGDMFFPYHSFCLLAATASLVRSKSGSVVISHLIAYSCGVLETTGFVL